MLRLPFRARAARPAPTRRTRLQFEELGGRYAPAAVTFQIGESTSYQSAAAPQPRIEDIALHSSGGTTTITGRIDGYVPGMTVTVQGGGAGTQTLTVNPETGEFSVTFTPDGGSVTFYLRDANGNEIDSEIVTY